ncbi:hypothetical protein BJ875DRAFT_221114 [Amylocarpus encephaloides]|uniref:F-box domain-containing protein n=1 Tax=Amylocarpus encephaloides TaxID=45428 RepID=A0A9P7YSZ9_9HELO|nr:hypothetical protein BJ875DRAFT_221114 [Amylocarpus encephaloides]
MGRLATTMSAGTPTKKRKTRGPFDVARPSIPSRSSWPLDALPVELFTLIISYLPRSSIQSMRLVNKEFENKVSEDLFRVVVVPFKPEIYGITGIVNERCINPAAVMLQDKGMRVFEGFGRRIRKFAMSFEFDESKLARPPIKNDQEAITSFWGIYRWPYKKYNRYAQLEGLEQTADETKTMAKALRFIECAKELGLSIDGGLGWLPGPDVNQTVIGRGDKPSVFGESRFIPEPSGMVCEEARKSARLGPKDSSSYITSNDTSRRSDFQRMLEEAGYGGEHLDASVRLMLETEDPSNESNESRSLDDYHSRPPVVETQAIDVLHRTIQETARPENGTVTVNQDQTDDAILPLLGNFDEKTDDYLKPNSLTTAQKEMLLEIEWAQRAFMQSYAIAVIDNPSTFQGVETLTIARLPSRHLPVLRRADFWNSLPQLQKLSLAVIPDWREVVKLPTSLVQDNRVTPSQSVTAVFQILSEHIAHRENIKRLHFEWLCGGEYAPGMFSRNQHVLAVPLVWTAMLMVNRDQMVSILSLPFVEHLSFKNAWVSPHVLNSFLTDLRKSQLQSLAFDSVSLSAMIPLNAQPVPTQLAQQVHMHAFHNHADAFQNQLNLHHNAQPLQAGQGNLPAPAWQGIQGAPPVVAVVPNQLPQLPANTDPAHIGLAWLDVRAGSWSHIIDTITPAITLEDIRYSRSDKLGIEPTPKGKTRLNKLQFKSCGYVRLPLDFDQIILDGPEGPVHTSHLGSKRATDIECFMMKPYNDFTLGTIINHMSAAETATLENAWSMNVGWTQLRHELAQECRTDGILRPGRGRFDGLIEASSSE